MGVAGCIAAALLLGALAYWLLIVTEGTYLGSRFVALLYDWTARRYDAIKQVRQIDEQVFLGIPLAQRLGPRGQPWVLDIATGTGRLPRALDGSGARVVGGDRARRMLRQARKAAAGTAVAFLQMDGRHLPFADQTFDAVTCLEALEFVPDAPRALGEMWRVMRPGGILLVTNRVGREARLFPWRIAGRGRMERTLAALGFVRVQTQRWQVDYDLVWAEKPQAAAAGNRRGTFGIYIQCGAGHDGR